jgi:hypothetical protein
MLLPRRIGGEAIAGILIVENAIALLCCAKFFMIFFVKLRQDDGALILFADSPRR